MNEVGHPKDAEMTVRLPASCPLNDGSYCPHRKTENAAYFLMALMMVNFIALFALMMWRSADRYSFSDHVVWCEAFHTANPTLNIKCE